MILRSIRWSMQLWHGVILLLVLAGFGYTAFELQRTRELRRVDEELQDRVSLLFGPRRPPGAGPSRRPLRALGDDAKGGREPRRELPDELPPNFERGFLEESEEEASYYAIWRRDGRIARASGVPADLIQPKAGDRPGIRTRGIYRELLRITPRGDTIVVGRSIEPEMLELRRLALLLLGSGAGILALGLAGGWMVASRAMRPIENISATAQKISSGDLSQRIPQEETESELGRLVNILNSTFTRLETAFSEQARFTADVSHELRTPVTVIVSQAQMALARDRSASEYRQTLEACLRAAQRMRALIESLMQLARLDAGQETIKYEPFDVARMAAETVEFLQTLAEGRRVRLATELSAVRAVGDAERMGQVLLNLITNAIHHTPQGGVVTVGTAIESGLVRITVKDTGVGIPAADLAKVFERFYRVDQSRSREKGGSGLGLAISKAIVSAHGGTIEVSSVPERGSTFTVRIPAER